MTPRSSSPPTRSARATCPSVGTPGAVGFELGLTSEDVEGDFRRAVEAGAEPLKEPEKTPWGQVTSYLRCPDGTVIDLRRHPA